MILVIQVNLKCNHMYYKREAEWDLTHTQRRRLYEGDQRDLKVLALSIEMMLPQAKNIRSLPELEDAKNDFSPRAS